MSADDLDMNFIFNYIKICMLPESVPLVLLHVFGKISFLCDDFRAKWALSSTSALSQM